MLTLDNTCSPLFHMRTSLADLPDRKGALHSVTLKEAGEWTAVSVGLFLPEMVDVHVLRLMQV